MDESRSERVSEQFEQALELSPDRRAAFLEELARREPDVCAELEALLASHAAAPDYLIGLADRVLPAALRALSDRGVPDLAAGRTVGRYRIIERIGGGGMGVVYKALDPTLNRTVALKFLSSHLGADPQARTRLIAEARAASALDHPNIAVVYEVGTIPSGADDPGGHDRLFIAMGYYAGQTLREKLAAGPLPLVEAASFGTQIAAGLARAHESGIVHRDIKPANLIVSERAQIKIVDFGIAKLDGRDFTQQGITPGTIAYMSPEQTRGERIDPRTDIWSAGVVLYEMIAGVRPFRGENDAVVIQAIRNDRALPLRNVRPEVPESLDRLVDRCLQKDPAARYPDAGALRGDLEAFAAEITPGAPVIRRPVRLPRGSRRIALGVGLALAAAAAAVMFLPRTPAADPATSEATVLVLPFLPPANDTALARLGRQLAVTLSATLDGIGDVRTIDASTVFAHLPDAGSPLTVERGRELARRLGAGRVLMGSIIGDGAAVRADARLMAIDDGDEVLARANVSVPVDHLVSLTDSLTLKLVHRLWRGGDEPVPSLGAVTTHSVSALRAYVDGEQALASGDMERAVDAFDRAFAADSSFWFAYWRSLYPRVYEGSRADTAVLAEVIRHRDELPERDRLLIEARLEPTVTARLGALQALVDRYATYWPAAWELANLRFHWAPQIGSTLADSRAALEKVVSLNPRFVPGWHHLFTLAAFQGDARRSRAALDTLERLVDSKDIRWYATLAYNRTILEAVERDGHVSAEQETAMAGVMRQMASQVPGMSWGQSGMLTPFGFPALQIRLNRQALASHPLQSHAADLRMGTTMAWAARGAWDSAAVELNAWRGAWIDARDALRAYGLGVLALPIGGWDAERVESLRRAAADAALAGDPHDRAELAWLDGIMAHSLRDSSGLANARSRIQRTRAPHAAALDQSLAAFEQAARGDEAGAARTLQRIELNAAEHYGAAVYAGPHPYLTPVNRLYAGRWLLADGDTAAAVRIFRWWQGAPASRDAFREAFATWAILPFVLTEQARIAAARGRVEDAVEYNLRIVRLYDLPSTARGAAILAEARAALESSTEARR